MRARPSCPLCRTLLPVLPRVCHRNVCNAVTLHSLCGRMFGQARFPDSENPTLPYHPPSKLDLCLIEQLTPVSIYNPLCLLCCNDMHNTVTLCCCISRFLVSGFSFNCSHTVSRGIDFQIAWQDKTSNTMMINLFSSDAFSRGVK